MRKILSVVLALTMLFSSFATTSFAAPSAMNSVQVADEFVEIVADDEQQAELNAETTVATVEGVPYTDIQKAIEDAAPDGTVEIVNNVTVDEWVMFAEKMTIGNGNLITLNINGLTINGNNNTLTIKNVESAKNGNRLFYDAQNLNIKDLTIEYVDAAANLGGVGLQSGTIENVKFVGGGYGILPGEGNITITGCNFKTNNTAIYYEKARNNLVVDNNTFELADNVNAILLHGDGRFTNNTVVSGRTVNVVSGSPVVTGNNLNNVRLKVYSNATATIEGNEINVLEFGYEEDSDGIVKSNFGENNLSEEAQTALDAVTVVKPEKSLSGAGTEEEPYLINNLEDLEFFRDSVNAGELKYNTPGVWVALGADIDMAGTVWTDGIGDGINATFDGNFDGKNKTIKNFTMEPYADDPSATTPYLCGGLFGYIYGNVQIKDVVFENVTITTQEKGHNVGVLVGFANNNGGKAQISNVTVKGDVKIDTPNASGVGAIVGYSYREMGTIADCTVQANDGSYIKGYTFVGGITGYSYSNAEITDCSVSDVDITAANYSAGGIVGIALAGNKVTGCTVSDVTVESQANKGYIVGAIASESVVVEDCTSPEPQVGGNYGDNSKVQAKLGNKYYKTFAAALENAVSGDVITVYDTVILEEDGTIDLKGARVNAASTIVNAPVFRVLADVTFTNGIVDGRGPVAGEGGVNCYAFIVGNSDVAGTLTINSGTYRGVTSAISITNGTANILGGTFQTGHDEEGTDYGTTYLLNCNDAAFKAGNAAFNITGGKFVGFNPENNAAEGANTNFLSGDYKASDYYDDDKWYVAKANIVMDDDKYFATIKDAFDTLKSADKSLHTIKLLADLDVDVNYVWYKYPILVNGFNILLDLNGKNITADWSKYTGGSSDMSLFMMANGGVLTITGEGEVRNLDSGDVNTEARIFWLMNEGSTLTIESGTFIQEDDIHMLYTQGGPTYTYIKGGNFQMVGFDDFFNSYDGVKQETVITGGTFSDDPSDGELVIPPEYKPQPNPDGSWGIVEKKVLSGAGTEDDPYVINNIDDLRLFRDEVNAGNTYEDKYVALKADIDLTGEVWTPIGTSCYDVTPADSDVKMFAGNFDGENHTITGLNSDGYVPAAEDISSGEYSFGLFGYVYGANISNVKLADVDIDGTTRKDSQGDDVGGSGVAALIGYYVIEDEKACVIENCHVLSGTVKASNNMGGLIGFMDAQNKILIADITIKNCTNAADVTTEAREVGGILGLLNHSNAYGPASMYGNITFLNCSNTGDITALDGGGSTCAGGILGRDGTSHNYKNVTIAFDNCSNSGTIKVHTSGESHAAGLGTVYNSDGSWLVIKNSTNTGDIIATESGDVYAGGLMAYAGVATIENSTSTGTVTVGGEAGNKYIGSANQCLFLNGMDDFADTIGGDIYYLNGGMAPDRLALYDDSGNPHLVETAYKDGFEFGGWYDNADFTGKAYTALDKNVNTYYAKWVITGLPGKGTEQDPFVINNGEQLKWLRDVLNTKAAKDGIAKYAQGQYFVLGKDIDLGGESWLPIYAFYGVLDGKNYTISNFECDTANGNGGLTQFMYGTIKNLTVSDVTATVGSAKIFAPIASTFKGSLDNVHTKNITATITAPGTADNAPSMVGGMIAWDGNQSGGHDGTVKNCSVENLYVTAYDGKYISVGGFVAVICRNLAEDSYDNNSVNGINVEIADATGMCQIGGFVAQTETGWNVVALDNCHVSGIDFEVAGTGMMIGGFIANPGAHTTVTNSTTEGTIDASGATQGKIGGFAADLGWNNNLGGNGAHQFTNCSADVEITSGGAYAGGFIGSTYSEETDDMDVVFDNCSATNVVDNNSYEGGFAGYADRGTYTNTTANDPFFGKAVGGATLTSDGSITFHKSFEEAYAAADDGDTITLLEEVSASQVITIDKAITLDGNGYDITSGASRVIRVTASDIEVTLENVNMVSTAVRVGQNDIRGISIDAELSNVVLTLNNCSVDFTDASASDWSYAVNQSGETSNGNTINVNGGTYEGANVINIWGNNHTVNVDGATLNSIYGINEMYVGVCVKVNGNGSADITLKNTTFNGDHAEAIQKTEDSTVVEENNTDNTKRYVVKAGAAYYHTLAEAFDLAAENDTIILLSDITLDETIKNEKTVTLDLNSKTITGTDNTEKNFSLIDNRGNLTITGNGKMTLTATVNSGWNRYSAVLANNPGGKLVIENGTFEHLGGTDMAYGIDNLTNGKGTYAETIINDGTIKSTYRGIRQFLNGIEAQNILTINGGTVEGANKSVWMQDPSKNANTGTLTVSENANLIGDVYLFVTAGSTEWPVEVSIAAAALEEGSAVVTGNVPLGYEVVNENGYYGVITTPVAMFNGVEYKTLQEAVDAANGSGTITLIDNTAGDVVVNAPSATLMAETEGLVIDLAGFTHEGTITVANGAVVTIKNGKIVDETGENSAIETVGTTTIENVDVVSGRHGVRVEGGFTTINNVNVKLVGTGKTQHAVNVSDGGEVVINGGTFVGPKGLNSDSGSAVCVQADSKVTINDGTFKNGKNSTLLVTGTLVICGGTFDQDPSAYVAEGYGAYENAFGTYNVSGERSITISATPTEVVAGEDVVVSVVINGKNLANADWTVTFDPSKFAYQGVTTGDNNNMIEGHIYLTDDSVFTDGYELATYTFKALAQPDVTTADFEISDTKAYTHKESYDATKVTATNNEKVTVTINLDEYEITTKLDGGVVTTESEEVKFTSVPHTFVVETDPDATVTYKVNGVDATNVSITEVGTYTITYTVSGVMGYETVTKTFTLVVGDADYVVEVNLTGDTTSDYVDGKKIVLVYTNTQDVFFKYDGALMVDVSDSGYMYETHTDNTVQEYDRVFAYVTDAIDGADLEAYRSKVKAVYDNTGLVTIDYSEATRTDLNFDNETDIRDITTAYGVLNKNEILFGDDKYQRSILKADINGDKVVDAQNDAEDVIGDAFPEA